ncbi:MAG: M3 family oligoendopeptidase [Candidatus Lokiarchaeota archaeon]|nr:M3 family oligoendopeptidase [Candidatus Lokiarchaeota archaeon]
MTEKEIKWDFSEMFSGIDDPKLPKTMQNLSKEADQFEKDYKGKIESKIFTAENLKALLKKIEDFSARADEVQLFSTNSFNANMTLPETQALNNKYREFQTQISKKLAFIDLEMGKLVYENKELISNPVLANYKHNLETIYRAFPHQLTEIEEQIILEKDQHGIRAWSQLQGAWLNTREFKVNVEGEEKILSYGEANNLFTHPDRNTRISANKAIYSLLGKDEEIFTTALRNICSDWVKNSKHRKYDSPMHDSLIVNDTTQEVIDSLIQTIEGGVDVYQRYLRIKAKLLNLPKLTCADVVAPLLEVPHKNYSWEEAKELIFEAFNQFDESFVEYAKDMFDKNHIDANIRKGKRNGAYCAGWYKGKSAFILMSFSGALREVYTLTHELGHAIHDYLASREQTYINVHPGYTVAETASTFGELLMTDLLLEKAETKEEKMAIIAHVLDEAGQAAFQVSARIFFEKSLYDAIDKGEHLDGKTVSKLWCAGRDKIYGDSVEWFEEMDWEWTMKGHYYIPNFRFYNYPYVYAQLFVYALYQTYKKEGKSFVPKFKKLLSSGGSVSPEELGNIVGLDISKPDFWKLGIKQYEDFVNQLENLIE